MDLFSSHRYWLAGAARSRLRRLAVDFIMWMTVLLPFLAWFVALLVVVAVQPAGWVDGLVFLIMYIVAGFGVTIGYHRLLAHSAFDAPAPVKAFFYITGCMAVQGPPMKWAAIHRRHHQKSDQPGDPHSPHLHDEGVIEYLKGLWHAHTGWLLTADPPELQRSIKDLAADPVIRFVDRFYLLWVVLGGAIPFALGWALTGSLAGGLTALLWGWAIRIAAMHHATWSVNSICHLYGYRRYETRDQSRNNPLIAMLSFGEGWHNNHHAFPTSARHGFTWYEVDPSYLLIRGLELLGLARRVRVPDEQTRRRKESAQSASAPAVE